MSKHLIPAFPVVAAMMLSADPAAAYIGPGLGAGAIAAVFGVLAAIVMAFVAVLWYPIKRLVTKRKTPEPQEPA